MGETEVVTVEHRDGERTDERIKDWSKRKDHRHHAIDALVVACTRQSYIQRLNRVNAEADREEMDVFIKEQQQEHKLSKREKLSLLEHWLIRQPHFTTGEVTRHVEGILVSLRPGKRTISRGRNIYKRSGKTDVQRGVLIPRGALSEETIYGVISVDGEDRVVCKYPLQSLKAKDVVSIVDEVLREKVIERITQHGEKEAFAKPLYLDEAQTQEVRSVRCFTGKDQAKLIPLRYNDESEAVGFVAPGSNHHLALYQDERGNLVESVVTFWQAISRIRYGLPAIVTHPREVMEQALSIPELPEEVLGALPESGLRLMEVLRMNDMFLIGMKDEEIEAAIEGEDYPTLSRYLYRVQKLSSMYYVFRYHLETEVKDEKNTSGEIPKFYRIKSLGRYQELNPRKVKIDLLGRISLA
jgi:CRISPR-associated protein